MPIAIVAKINLLKPSMVNQIKPEESESFLKVTFGGDKETDLDFGKFNDDDITFLDFYNLWIDIMEEISNWLKDKIDI